MTCSVHEVDHLKQREANSPDQLQERAANGVVMFVGRRRGTAMKSVA